MKKRIWNSTISLVLCLILLSGCVGAVAEEQKLEFVGQVMTLENGVRFLTDYLDGDKYFAVHRPHHNLDRARAQLTLLTHMEEKWEEMLAALS